MPFSKFIRAEDLLFGAAEIAEFLYGDKSKRRQVYHLAQSAALPVFKLGATLCAKKSSVRHYIEALEGQRNLDGQYS